MEREDWMTKAMPKSAPGAGKEAADAAAEELLKKVVHASFERPSACLVRWEVHRSQPSSQQGAERKDMQLVLDRSLAKQLAFG